MNNIRILPSRRFCILFALTGIWFMFVPVFGQILATAGYIYMGIILLFFIVDVFRLLSFRKSEINRDINDVLSVGIANSVKIRVKNSADFKATIHFRDDCPNEFEVLPSTCIARFPANSTAVTEYKVIPPRRGDYKFGNIHFRVYTEISLAILQADVPNETAVKVYPDVSKNQQHAILSKVQRTREMGLRVSRLIGQGREFERLRDYQPDDELRMIDWNASARRAKLTTREFDIERNQQVMILLDMGRTMASRTMDANGNEGPTKADLAINAAVLLSYVASQWDDRVGLCCFADKVISYIPPGKGKNQSARILDELYMHQPRMEESNYRDVLIYLDSKQHKRCLVILLTDLIDVDSSARLISSIGIISKHHLTVCVALSDYELNELVETEPANTDVIFNQAVALNIMNDRKNALAALAAKGALIVDAAPADLNVSTVNKYLQLKREGRI